MPFPLSAAPRPSPPPAILGSSTSLTAQLLINNAGIYSGDGRRPKLEEFTAADFLPVFMTNSVGPFLVIQQLLARQLLGPPGSLVVNVSSIMGSNSDPTVSAVTPGAYAYRCGC
jgi:NAD(P)-dependent dehydrogenase (short-subunit alcohol dehydrogenase family)